MHPNVQSDLSVRSTSPGLLIVHVHFYPNYPWIQNDIMSNYFFYCYVAVLWFFLTNMLILTFFLITAISPASTSYTETISTLRYAAHAKNILNKPHVNEVGKQQASRMSAFNMILFKVVTA